MTQFYSGLPVENLIQQARKVQSSPAFRRSKRLSTLFAFLLEETLAGRGEAISQYGIAYDCFKMRGAFDAGQNSLIRTHVLRLKKTLAKYFEEEGQQDELYIRVAENGYSLIFSRRGFLDAKLELERTRPVVAVFRFATLADTPSHLDFSTFLADELVAALDSHAQWRILGPLDPLATDGSEREKLHYVESFGASVLLDGSIYASNGKYVVLFRLKCLKTHLQIWSHRCECGDFNHSILDELNAICRQISHYLGFDHGVISSHLSMLAALKPQQSQSIFDLVSLCWSAMRNYNFSNISHIVQALRDALKEDSEDAVLNASLVVFLTLAKVQPQFREKTADKEIENNFRKALIHEPNGIWTWIASAFFYSLKGDSAGLADLAARIKEANITNQSLLGCVGLCLCLQNVIPEEGLILLRKACSLNPDYPKVFHIAIAVQAATRQDFELMFQELKRVPASKKFRPYQGTTDVDEDLLSYYPQGAWGEPLLRAYYHAQRGEFEETSYYWNVFVELNNGSIREGLERVRVLWSETYVDQFTKPVISLLQINV